MKLKSILVVLVAAILMVNVSCYWPAQSVYDLEEALEKADTDIGRGNYDLAEKQCYKAKAIAERMDFTDGLVMAQMCLANVHRLGRLDQVKGEKILNDALKYCFENADCSSEPLATIFDGLHFVYLYKMEDKQRRQTLINTLFNNKHRLSGDRDFRVLLKDYADTAREAGYQREAAEIEARLEKHVEN
ncbi:MAG: hypothetical protein HKN25_02145 [Pyrinomonadaceae bacterium]|nr:hypothetical protein [Pyrinomonadaceae bacterium]